MQSLKVPFLFIAFALIASQSVCQQQTTISGTSDPSSFSLTPNAGFENASLVLDGLTSDAEALYKQGITLKSSSAATSFTVTVTFSTNSTYGNGTLALVLVPQGASLGSLAAARKTVSVEFNTTCAGNISLSDPFFNRSGDGDGDGRGFGGGYGGGPWGGFPFHGGPAGGFLGGLQVQEYANGTAVASQDSWTWPNTPDTQGLYPPDQSGQYFCSAQPDVYPLYQYQVVIAYNATTNSLGVGTPNCGPSIVRFMNFSTDLSGVIAGEVQVGFIVSGGIYNILQWNFSSNPTTDALSSLAALVSSSVASGVGSNSGSNNGGGNGGGGPKRGYVVGFSVLGAVIGAAVVLGVCCLCRKATLSRRSGSHAQIPEGAIIYEATKPGQAQPKETDTAPLRRNSSDFAVTATANWLRPVTAR